jgi:hypothetical protein
MRTIVIEKGPIKIFKRAQKIMITPPQLTVPLLRQLDRGASSASKNMQKEMRRRVQMMGIHAE